MSDYIAAPLKMAQYHQLSTGEWFAAVPQFHVVMAIGATQEACSHALQDDLESAVVEALQHGRALPQLVGVNTPTLAVAEEC